LTIQNTKPYVMSSSQQPSTSIYASNVVCNDTNPALNTSDGLHDHTNNRY
jgi:hypothetical protein